MSEIHALFAAFVGQIAAARTAAELEQIAASFRSMLPIDDEDAATRASVARAQQRIEDLLCLRARALFDVLNGEMQALGRLSEMSRRM